jgi:4-methylaminobutanoate oxidase (formaldehyde-forming)
MDRAVGTISYTQLCNERGGIECDLTMVRTAADRWYVVTGSAFGAHDMGWIRANSPDDGSVEVRDVTSSRAVINVCGPLSRQLLERVCEESINNEVHPYGVARWLTLQFAPVFALRVGYVGELGWELHVPTEYARHVYESLLDAGADLGVIDAGYRTIDTMRMEKGYVYWSTDVTPDTNPFEAGLGGRIRFDKGNFIGRDALLDARSNLKRRLAVFTLEDMAYPVGGEAIIYEGEVVGFTTSANFGHTIGKPIAYGYVPSALDAQADFIVEVYGEPIRATRHNGALYDSGNERLRG